MLWHKRFRRGDQLTAGRLNREQQKTIRVGRGGRNTNVKFFGDGRMTVQNPRFQIIPIGGGGGGGATLFDVVIAKVIEVEADVDPANANEVANFASFAGHLKCYTVAANGVPQVPPEPMTSDPYLVVNPHFGHTLSQFKAVGYSLTLPVLPIYTVYSGSQGLTMMLGDGELWVEAPQTENLCGQTGG